MSHQYTGTATYTLKLYPSFTACNVYTRTQHTGLCVDICMWTNHQHAADERERGADVAQLQVQVPDEPGAALRVGRRGRQHRPHDQERRC